MRKDDHNDHDQDHDHQGHAHEPHDHDHGPTAAGQLTFAITLLSLTFVAEVIGGIWTGSLALLADAGHVFMDLFALTLSLVAARLARLPANNTQTYGWHRAEILAALINGTMLIVLSIALYREAWERFQEPSEILTKPMFVVAVIGLIVNIVIAYRLHGHHGSDLNLKSAYLHVLGDTGASVGVVVAAVIISFTGWSWVDPMISAVIGLLILFGAVRLLFNAGHILLESVPKGISLKAVGAAIEEVEGVTKVHDVHIWAVCSHIVNLSCHINIEPRTPAFHDRVVKAISEMLWKRFCIMHPTIQVEYEACSEELVCQDMEHPAGQ